MLEEMKAYEEMKEHEEDYDSKRDGCKRESY